MRLQYLSYRSSSRKHYQQPITKSLTEAQRIYFLKDEQKAADTYRRFGLDGLAADEARHVRFFKDYPESLDTEVPQANDVLAKRMKDGGVWLHPNLPEKVDGIDVQNRVLTHEVKYWTLRDHGVSEAEARLEAERAELVGLSNEQIIKYHAVLDTVSNGKRWQ